MKIKDAIAKFLLWRKYKISKIAVNGDDCTLRYFAMAMKNCEVELVNLDMVLEWLNAFEEMEFDQNTILKKCITLHKFFSFLKLQGLNVLEPELIPTPRRKFAMPRVADDNDFEKFLAAIPTEDKHYWHIRNRALILIQSQAGCRISENLLLDTDMLSPDLSGATIKTAKSRGKRPFRQLYWRKEATAALSAWLVKREELMIDHTFNEPKALWVSLKGGHHQNNGGADRLAMAGVKEIFRKYSNKAGLDKNISTHQLRHRVGRQLTKAGANNAVISSVLGHAQLSSSFVYTELFGSEIGDQYKKYLDN
jgi:site-specific recombinase XerD